MKKWFFILLISFCFIPFMKVNAFAILCSYEGYIGGDDWNMGGDNPKAAGYIGIDGHNFYIDVPTYIHLDSISQDVGYGPYNFILSETMESAQRQNQVVLSTKNWTSVYWKNSSEMQDLINKGKCPSVFSFGYAHAWGLSVGDMDNDVEFIISEVQSDSYDTATRMQFPVPRYSNYYPTMEVFNSTTFNKYNGWSTTCITDTETLDNIISWFNMTWQPAATDVEKKQLAKFFDANGYSDVARNFINTYKPGSDCYENNPSMQSKFDELVAACNWYLSLLDEDVDLEEVSSCEQIVGTGTFAYYLNITFRFIQYLGPIIVIVYSTIEYIKVAAASDSDLLKKTNKRTITRLIFAALLFFIPMIIKIFLNIFGFYGDCLDTIL